ncbi:hypothetical protein ACFLTX_02460 [Chloroflexota bacterium]
MTNTFDTLILVGRPASGKSEIIDYLLHLEEVERRRHFHLSGLDILDDFPMLWAWFEEDALLEKKFHKPRLHTDRDGYFLHGDLWHLLIERLDLDFHKHRRDDPDYSQKHTSLLEFSRGIEHGGYAAAFSHFSDDLLDRAAVLYVQVSFEESMRKNRLRFNPQRPDSILEHGLPDEKMERLYKDDDWESLTASNPHFLQIRDVRIPYVVFNNDDDVTTNKPDQLASRLEDCLDRLWRLRNEK